MTSLLLSVGSVYPKSGGLQRHFLEFCDYIAKTKHSVTIVVSGGKNINSTKKILLERYPNFKIVVIPTRGFYSMRFYSLFSLLKIYNEIKISEIIHLHDFRFLFFPTILFGRKKMKIFSSHGFFFHNGFPKVKVLLFKIYVKIINRINSKVICVSKSDERICEHFNIKDYLYIPNWTKHEFHKFEVKEKMIVYFGRLESNKGINLLFSKEFTHALKLHKIKLFIVGSGKLSGYVRRSIDKHGDHFYKEFLSDDELTEVLAKAKWAIFPSTREGFGLTVLEAIAHNCECLLNVNSNYKEIFENGPVHYVDFNDLANLTSALSHETSAEEKRLFLNFFNYEQSMQNVISLYRYP